MGLWTSPLPPLHCIKAYVCIRISSCMLPGELEISDLEQSSRGHAKRRIRPILILTMISGQNLFLEGRQLGGKHSAVGNLERQVT